MGFHLEAAECAAYARDGCLFPLPVLTTQEVAEARRCIEAFEGSLGGPLPKELRHKPHLYSSTIDTLIRKPEIVDRVESLLGPDILCWETVLFIKEPGDAAFVSWHQDVAYWGLEPYDVLTAWVALSPSTRRSGCMRVLPGSHLGEVAPHKDTFAADNMLSRGQEMQVDVDESRVLDIELQPGEMSLHHVMIAHGSDPNSADDRRIGLAIRYIPAHVRQVIGPTDTATVVRGVDRHGHFQAEPRPSADFTPEGLETQRRLRAQRMAVLMRSMGGS
ncbi:MAG: phytanoyl-CoA dioxygenase family protein [Rubrivivax sp.]|jgi:ectoine hydroxylase-related dioxygenase (phytanoyl-CoA dioxygenase family)